MPLRHEDTKEHKDSFEDTEKRSQTYYNLSGSNCPVRDIILVEKRF